MRFIAAAAFVVLATSLAGCAGPATRDVHLTASVKTVVMGGVIREPNGDLSFPVGKSCDNADIPLLGDLKLDDAVDLYDANGQIIQESGWDCTVAVVNDKAGSDTTFGEQLTFHYTAQFRSIPARFATSTVRLKSGNYKASFTSSSIKRNWNVNLSPGK